MTLSSRSRRVSLVALLTSLAIVLNFVVSIPAPFADFLFYEVWEVPILVSLLLLGFWGGTSVALLNTIVLEAVKPGPLPTGPIYNLIAEMSMFVGVLAAVSAGGRRNWKPAKTVLVATGAGVGIRTAVMTAVNAVVLAQPYPVGFGPFVTEAQVPALLVLIGIFNITVALYTVPLAFSVTRAIESRIRPMARRLVSG